MWIVEITMEFTPGVYLTNGFTIDEPVKIYHINAWLMIFSSLMTSFFTIYNLDKIIYGKKEKRKGM